MYNMLVIGNFRFANGSIAKDDLWFDHCSGARKHMFVDDAPISHYDSFLGYCSWRLLDGYKARTTCRRTTIVASTLWHEL